MSVFKAGQRVRIVGPAGFIKPELVGREGTFLRYGLADGDSRCLVAHDDCLIMIDGFPSPELDRAWGANSAYLSPLLDPGADAFMERIKRLGREPINLAEKVTR